MLNGSELGYFERQQRTNRSNNTRLLLRKPPVNHYRNLVKSMIPAHQMATQYLNGDLKCSGETVRLSLATENMFETHLHSEHVEAYCQLLSSQVYEKMNLDSK